MQAKGRTIGVVGGGLAGLTVAMRLSRAGHAVHLYEAEARLGGQVWTEQRHGYVIEHGAEGFVARSQALQRLSTDLGIADELVGQALERSFGYEAGRMVALAAGEAAQFLGFQVPHAELGKGIRSYRRGMGALVAALRAASPTVAWHPATRVLQLEPGAEATRIRLHTRDEPPLACDTVVLAVGALAAADLLEPLMGEPARALRASPTLSSVTVSLAYRREAVGHALDGTGLVVRDPEQHEGLRACTFTSSKFEARAPDNCVSLRGFFRPEAGAAADLDDADWIARAIRQLQPLLQLAGAPEYAWVSHWHSALPVHDAEHRRRVQTLELALESLPIRLAGAAFHGSGIDAAIVSAERVAAALG